MTKVFIIILHFKGLKHTRDCLKSLRKLKTENIEVQIVLVDNNSRDAVKLKKAIKKLSKLKIKLIENKKNLGFAKGNNVGIRYALKNKADYLLILNNDTLVHEDTLAGLIKFAKKDEKIGIVSPLIYFAPGFEFHKKRYKKSDLGKVIWYAGGIIDWKNILARHRGVDEIDIGRYEKAVKTGFATGCCMLIKKQVFDSIGLFNPKYFLYWEDIDLSQRAKNKDFKIYFCPQAILWHKNATSTGSGGFLHDYYLTRNRLLFGLKYASFKVKASLIKESLVKLVKGRKGEKRGIIDFWRLKFGSID